MSDSNPERGEPMANAQLDRMMTRLRKVSAPLESRLLTDRELIHRFAQSHDEQAFAQLLDRHGGMVYGVCKRILRHQQDAEDALQAVFLVLARKANSIAWSESISHWLYEVAYRTALKSRTTRFRRQNRERLQTVPEPATPETPGTSQLTEILDEEIRRLPKRYGSAVILCCLQESSIDEAATKLGVTEGAIRARLWRGRELLRQRLASRGVALPAALISTTFLVSNLCAIVPSRLVLSLPKQATQFFQRIAETTPATTLAHGVLKAMFIHKLKWSAAVAIGCMTLLLGTAWVVPAATKDDPEPKKATPPRVAQVLSKSKQVSIRNDEPADPDTKRETFRDVVFKTIDPLKGTISVEAEFDNDQRSTVTFLVGKDATILVAREQKSISDLKPNMIGSIILLAENRETVIGIEAGWRPFRSKLQSIDAKNNQVTVKLEAQNDLEIDQLFQLIPNASITLDDLKVGLEDLSIGADFEFELSADKKRIVRIDGKGNPDEVYGILKRVDLEKRQILITLEVSGFRAERRVDLAFDLDPNTRVRYEGTDSKLDQLQPGMKLRLRFNDDRKTINAISSHEAVKQPDRD